jgi:hypothetical protein
MWKASGKTTTLLLFLDSLFPETETYMRNASSGDKATKLRDASSGDKATKCSNHSTISLIAYTPKIVAKILRRRTEKKIEDVL